MDVFSTRGAAGAGAGNAAFLVVIELLAHLKKTGALSQHDINSIADAALANVPSGNNTIQNDTRELLNSIKR